MITIRVRVLLANPNQVRARTCQHAPQAVTHRRERDEHIGRVARTLLVRGRGRARARARVGVGVRVGVKVRVRVGVRVRVSVAGTRRAATARALELCRDDGAEIIKQHDATTCMVKGGGISDVGGG